MNPGGGGLHLDVVIDEARTCRACEAELPRGCRPLLQGSRDSRVLLISQAPGAAAHESGVPWDDRSGDRLRDWLGVTKDEFYDPSKVGILPMGLCYPGKGASGDLRPRPECAPMWHDRLLPVFGRVGLTLYVGRFAFERYLSAEFETLTDAVRGGARLLPGRAALPHPSPRNNIWLKRHGWFERECLPRIRGAVRGALSVRSDRCP